MTDWLKRELPECPEEEAERDKEINWWFKFIKENGRSFGYYPLHPKVCAWADGEIK